jgi:hypothetical protein
VPWQLRKCRRPDAAGSDAAGLDGIELSNPTLRQLPILTQTARDGVIDKVVALEVGAGRLHDRFAGQDLDLSLHAANHVPRGPLDRDRVRHDLEPGCPRQGASSAMLRSS